MNKLIIRTMDENHSKKVQDHLFALGYSWANDKNYHFTSAKALIAYEEDMRIYCSLKANVDEEMEEYSFQEVELITEVDGDVVCNYFKNVKKMFGFKILNDYLIAVGENEEFLAYVLHLPSMLLTFNVKLTLECRGYDTSLHQWNENGSIKMKMAQPWE